MDATDIGRQTRDAEIDAIKRVVSVLQQAQQNELPDEFVGLVPAGRNLDDGRWQAPHHGRDEISAFTHQVLPGAMKESTATYKVTHVLFVRPDVTAGVKVPPSEAGDARRCADRWARTRAARS